MDKLTPDFELTAVGVVEVETAVLLAATVHLYSAM